MRQTNEVLTDNDLRRYAPSIFAEQPWHAMSSKYVFIPTVQVVEKMRREGFQPVSALQSRTRIAGKGDFTKHVIRFQDRRNGLAPVKTHLGQLFMELILTNSHDGASAYKLDLGMKRLVCMNGMTVDHGEHSSMNVRHTGRGNVADAVIEASYQVIEDGPLALDAAERFNALRLTEGERTAFGTAALALRYPAIAEAQREAAEAGLTIPVMPVTVPSILRATRTADAAPTLWNTFNVTQERLTVGGDARSAAEPWKRVKVRAVSGIAENAHLNKALWRLTEAMEAQSAKIRAEIMAEMAAQAGKGVIQ